MIRGEHMRVSIFLLLIVIAVWLAILEKTGLSIRVPFDPALGIVGLLAGIAVGVILAYYSIKRPGAPQLRNISISIATLALLAAGSIVLLGFSIIDMIMGRTQILGLIVWPALAASSILLIYDLIHRYRKAGGGCNHNCA